MSGAQKWIKQIVVKVFPPDMSRPTKYIQRAGNGRVLLPEAEDQVLARVADIVEQRYPGVEYRAVKIGPYQHNFVPVKAAA